MNKRLDITIFGTEYTVGMVKLNRDMVKAGMKAYGPKEWNRLVNDIALNPQAKKTANEVGHTLGHPFNIVYRETGIILQGRNFGMETFWGGDFFPIETVESQNRTLQPSQVMRDYEPKDILGVFWGRREGAMFFRWDDVTDLKQEELILSYDCLSPALARRKSFDIVTDVTFRGRKGRRKDVDSDGEFEIQKHVFHMKN